MTGAALLAAPPPPPDDVRGSKRPRKGRREAVRAACSFCCARKIKCDALRPQCSACMTRGRVCRYDTKDDSETRGAAIKRRCEDLERQLAALSLLRCDACQQQASLQASEWVSLEEPDLATITSPTESEAPLPYEASVLPHATEIVSALLSSTDEDSTGILAALRIGLPWKSETEGSSSFSSLLMEPHRLWLDVVPPRVAASVGDTAGTTQTIDDFGKGGTSDLTLFDRRIWIRELVMYDKSAGNVVEHIQVVSNPSMDSPEISQDAKPTRTYANSKTSLRCTYQVPLCALASMIDIGDERCPFVREFIKLSREIQAGADVQAMFGSHAHLSALTSKELFDNAPRLSQVVANMVNSIKLDGDEGDVPRTRSACMWLHWLLWKWLLDTSAASFHALPDMLRPTPWQLTVPHPLVFDFIFIPAIRDHLCQERILDCQWLTQACASICCDGTPDDFYAINPDTGQMDLSDAAKAYVSLPDSWSLGPSVRPFFYNIDKFCRVRSPIGPDVD